MLYMANWKGVVTSINETVEGFEPFVIDGETLNFFLKASIHLGYAFGYFKNPTIRYSKKENIVIDKDWVLENVSLENQKAICQNIKSVLTEFQACFGDHEKNIVSVRGFEGLRHGKNEQLKRVLSKGFEYVERECQDENFIIHQTFKSPVGSFEKVRLTQRFFFSKLMGLYDILKKEYRSSGIEMEWESTTLENRIYEVLYQFEQSTASSINLKEFFDEKTPIRLKMFVNRILQVDNASRGIYDEDTFLSQFFDGNRNLHCLLNANRGFCSRCVGDYEQYLGSVGATRHLEMCRTFLKEASSRRRIHDFTHF